MKSFGLEDHKNQLLSPSRSPSLPSFLPFFYIVLCVFVRSEVLLRSSVLGYYAVLKETKNVS